MIREKNEKIEIDKMEFKKVIFRFFDFGEQFQNDYQKQYKNKH